jgi:hypothetical protein
LIGLQFGDPEIKGYLKLHLSHMDHIAIQSELGYLFEENATAAGTSETHWVMGWS